VACHAALSVGTDAYDASDAAVQVGVFLQHTATFVTGFIVAFTRSWDMTLVLMGCLPFLAGMGGIMVRLITVLTNKATAAYTDVSKHRGCIYCSMQVLAYLQHACNASIPIACAGWDTAEVIQPFALLLAAWGWCILNNQHVAYPRAQTHSPS
jgi:hypothetical protein